MSKYAIVALLALATLFGCKRQGEDLSSLEWTSMGTIAAVRARGGSPTQARDAAQEVFIEVERLLNVHDSNSEINRLAALSDDDVIKNCSPIVRPCYEAAFCLMRQSNGAFNPRWKGPNTLDLGAIAKGFAVDLAAQKIADVDKQLGSETLVDLGGNLKAVTGQWRTGLHGSDEVFSLSQGEGVATSGEYYRGSHICDGRTGKKLSTEIYSVTVIHPSSAMMADALSTTLFVLGRQKGQEFLSANYPEARAIWIQKKK